MKPNPKIIIIGAGASGLACASRLLKNGMSNIIILEAENRSGGRIHSTKFGDSFADLGGQWCHGEKNNIVYEMVKDMNILKTAKNSYQDNTYYLSKGKIVDKSASDKLFSIANSIYGDSKSVDTQFENFGDYFIRTFQQEVEKEYGNNVEILNLAKLMLDWFHKFYLCLEAAETWYDVPRSSSFPYETCEGDQQLHWGTGGYQTILDVLLEKIPDPSKQIRIDDKLMLNKEVNSVSWDLDDDSGVIVECADGTLFKADHVVVTVSLGVLKHGHKKIFKPELPFNKQNAIEGLSMGNTKKILLRFTEKWWPDDLTGFSLVWNEDDKINLANEFPHGPIEGGKSWLEDILGFYVIDSHPNVLLGWLVGEQTRKVELLTDEVVTSGCMHLLNKFAGHLYDIPEPIDILRSKWGNNKHFYGSYSHVSMETERRGVSKDDLSKPVFSKNNKPTLLFAGEHTHPHYFSTVHGAIETGYREAGRLLNIYRNPKGKDSKIAIIGAGLAGIGAAITLFENGCHDVTILEAQDYVGGRTNSEYYGGTLVDTGAQWLHGKNNPLYITAIENNLLSENITGEGLGIMVRSDGSIVDKNLVDDSKSQIENILEELEAWKSNDYQLSAGEFLENRFKEYTETFPPKVRPIQLEIFNWYKLFLVNDNSCYNLNDLSIRNFKNYDCPGGQDHVTFKNGYKSLIDVLVNKLPANTIQLNSAVTKITIEKSDIDSTILLECVTGKTVCCDYLINTMPLGVLKSFRASIPYLPKSISDAISNMGYDSFGKIVLIFDYKWWDFEGCQFLWECGENAETTVEWVKHIVGFDVFNEDDMMMVGWVGGNAMEEMEKLTEDQVGEHSVNVLRKFLRNYTIPYPIKTYRSTWLSNPWIRGGHSYLSTACDRSNCDNSDLAKPVYIDGEMKMLFTGEAVNSSHFSTTHGAFQSGQAQAKVLYEYLVDA